MTVSKLLECPNCGKLMKYVKDINGFISFTCSNNICNVFDLRIMTPEMHKRYKG